MFAYFGHVLRTLTRFEKVVKQQDFTHRIFTKDPGQFRQHIICKSLLPKSTLIFFSISTQIDQFLKIVNFESNQPQKSSHMFKKRNIEKKVDLNKDIQTIEIRQQEKVEDDKNSVPKSMNSKKIAKADKEHVNTHQKAQQPKKMKYGLIQKQAPEVQERPKVQNSIQNLYVKKRMQERNTKKQKQEGDTSGIEIIQMTKQLMAGNKSKITEYDVKEIPKKLQKLATEAIKNELENRNRYLVDLLQNQYERMEYASKKELKVMKQERQRLEKELSSKYTNEGRRHYIQYLKHQNLNG